MTNSLLIVDDSPCLHKLVRACLEPESLEIHSAHDGAAALTAVMDLRPGLILLDVDMPNLDGFEVCRRLKDNPSTTRVPVIFLTSNMLLNDKVKGLNLGAADYVTKPFKPEELRARVKSVIRFKSSMDQSAMLDWLTGIGNRKFLDLHVKAQLSAARRSTRPLACVIGDVDSLGKINEAHGSAIGDELLRAAAQIFQKFARAEDVVCYVGDGRFVVLLPDTDRAGAVHLADRLRAEIQSKITTVHRIELNATCSFGVADTQPECDVSLMDRADAALYRAKQSGGNAVSVSRPTAAEACGIEGRNIASGPKPS